MNASPDIAVDLAADPRGARAHRAARASHAGADLPRRSTRPPGAELFFKCENFQEVGAFKARGASNAVFSLDDAAAARGVVTHSSGNHGAALAYAARRRGIPAWIVMPDNCAGGQAGQRARLRRDECASAHPTVAAREAACAAVAARNRRDADPSVQRLARDRRAGDRGARAARPGARSRCRDRAGGWRRTALGDGDCGEGREAGHPRLRRRARGADDAQRSLAAGHIVPQERPRRSPTACAPRSATRRSRCCRATFAASARAARRRSSARCA